MELVGASRMCTVSVGLYYKVKMGHRYYCGRRGLLIEYTGLNS